MKRAYYVAVHRDEHILQKSSSGGMFTIFAEYILLLGGVICGAVFDVDTQMVRHVFTDSMEGVDRMRKSKYVWSKFADVVQQIGVYLESGRPVLFSGTPCQAASVQARYSEYDNLYILDLFCRGVSRGEIFSDYIRRQKKNVRNIDFRYGPKEDSNYIIKYTYGDGSTEKHNWSEDAYATSYVWSLNIRQACMDCIYTKRHMSDWTVGDWDDKKWAAAHGLMAKHPSILVVNSNKGKRVLEAMKDRMYLFPIRDEGMVAAYYQLHQQGHGAWAYDRHLARVFLNSYREKGFYAAFYEVLYPNIYQRITDANHHYAGENVFIYGAGYWGQICCAMITRCFPHWKITGYVVTKKGDRRKEPEYVIVALDELTDDDREKAWFVIAVKDETAQSIIYQTLMCCGVKKKQIIQAVLREG